MSTSDPKIIAFCCNESGYPAANMAGTLKQKFPKNVEIVRVPCAGRIETTYLIKALEKGADGVMVFACHEGNCQYFTGNLRIKGRLSRVHQMLEKIGLEKERLEICNLATNNGVKLAETLRKKSERLKRMGPNPGKI